MNSQDIRENTPTGVQCWQITVAYPETILLEKKLTNYRNKKIETMSKI